MLKATRLVAADVFFFFVYICIPNNRENSCFGSIVGIYLTM